MSERRGRWFPIEDVHFTAPIYTKTQAATIVGVPAQTFRNWAVGYTLKRLSGPTLVGEAIVTTADPQTRQGPSVPFIGLAEAYTLAAFRAAGVPLQRVRPAIRWLQQHIGLEQALASERLVTDGAEVLWDFRRRAADSAEIRDAVAGLVVVRGQQIFRPVVRDYLKQVTYQDGWVRLIHLPMYTDIDVVVDPYVNGGFPTIARRGIRVNDIVSRLRAGESVPSVAHDYDLRPTEVQALLPQAA